MCGTILYSGTTGCRGCRQWSSGGSANASLSALRTNRKAAPTARTEAPSLGENCCPFSLAFWYRLVARSRLALKQSQPLPHARKPKSVADCRDVFVEPAAKVGDREYEPTALRAEGDVRFPRTAVLDDVVQSFQDDAEQTDLHVVGQVPRHILMLETRIQAVRGELRALSTERSTSPSTGSFEECSRCERLRISSAISTVRRRRSRIDCATGSEVPPSFRIA